MALNVYCFTALTILLFTASHEAVGQVTDQYKRSDIRLANWLIGTWENKTEKGNLYESWRQQDDKLLLGRSYFVEAGDTVMLETIRLAQLENGLYYLPTVKNQNGGKEIAFKASKIGTDSLVFNNLTHDFPQKIGYYKLGQDSLKAEISGYRNGKKETRFFPMKRTNNRKSLE